LRGRTYSAQELGIEQVAAAGGQTIRWKERLSPKEPVAVPLLPAESAESNQPRVSASINGGQPVPLTIDTGAALNVLGGATAVRDHVKVADPASFGNTFTGLGGKEFSYYGMMDQLAMGGFTVKNVFTVIRPGRPGGSETASDLLGATTLAKLAFLTIDYPKREAVFSTDTPFVSPAKAAASVPYVFQSLQIVVEVGIRGQYAVNVLLDTGNDAALMLTEDLITELGLTEAAAGGAKGRYGGIGGVIETRTFTLNEISLNGQTFAQIPVVVVPNYFPPTLGSGFLKQFRTTIDFRAQKIWLE
jgi:predicted aspartyl protease